MAFDGLSMTFMETAGLFLLFLLSLLIVLWLLLPFSVFGIKGLIREAIEEQKRTNELLTKILDSLKSTDLHGDEK